MEQTTTPRPAPQGYPYAQTQQPTYWGPPTPEPYKPSHAFSLAKLGLGGLNMIFAIVAFGLGLSFVLGPSRYNSHTGAFLLVVLAAISFLWQAAEFLTRLLRRRTHRPLHPGAHVGVHLCLWVLLVLCTYSMAWGLRRSLAQYTVVGPASRVGADPYLYDLWWDRFASEGEAARFFARLRAAVAFAALLALAHFVLFVLACVETDRRRKWGRRQQVVYVPTTTTTTNYA